MTRRFINQLKPGEQVEDQIFLIRSKDLRTTTQGGMYIHAVLADRTGQITARAWQATEAMFNALPEGGFVRLKGRTENYKGSPQFIIDSIRTVEPDSIEIADFLPTSEGNIEEMFARVVEILGKIKHPQLSALMGEFLADEHMMDGFRRSPAAVVMHHAYIGGLLEHTLNLMEMALKVVPQYPKLSLDLVLAGIFLHDIGKTNELNYETNISYSDEGQLLGHITKAVMWIEKKVEAVAEKTGEPFPDPVRLALEHIVLSHHGQYEFGSPKLPALPEAIAVHYLDNFDAKLNMFFAEIENAPDAASHWTNYNRALETKIYRVDVMGTRDA